MSVIISGINLVVQEQFATGSSDIRNTSDPKPVPCFSNGELRQ